MLKTVCTDKRIPSGQVRGTAGYCYKRGVKSGFVAGLNKALKKQVRIRPILNELINARPQLRQAPRQPIVEIQLPSLTALNNSRNDKATRKARDFYSQLPIRNPNYQYGQPSYKSVDQKKRLGTVGLRQWLIQTGEYRA